MLWSACRQPVGEYLLWLTAAAELPVLCVQEPSAPALPYTALYSFPLLSVGSLAMPGVPPLRKLGEFFPWRSTSVGVRVFSPAT